MPQKIGGWWRWALVRPDEVAPSRMVGVSASVNLPLHHKVQKFSSGTGSLGDPGKRAVKRLWVVWCKFHATVLTNHSKSPLFRGSTIPNARLTVRVRVRFRVRLMVRISRSIVSRVSFRVSRVGFSDKFRVRVLELRNSGSQSTLLLGQQHGHSACEKPAQIILKVSFGNPAQPGLTPQLID